MQFCSSCSIQSPLLMVEPRQAKFSTVSSSFPLTVIGSVSAWCITTVFFVLIISANSAQVELNLSSRRWRPPAECETSAALSARSPSTWTLRILLLALYPHPPALELLHLTSFPSRRSSSFDGKSTSL